MWGAGEVLNHSRLTSGQNKPSLLSPTHIVLVKVLNHYCDSQFWIVSTFSYLISTCEARVCLTILIQIYTHLHLYSVGWKATTTTHTRPLGEIEAKCPPMGRAKQMLPLGRSEVLSNASAMALYRVYNTLLLLGLMLAFLNFCIWNEVWYTFSISPYNSIPFQGQIK